MDNSENFYQFLRNGTGFVCMALILSGLPFKVVDFLLSTVVGKENLLLVNHNNMLDFRLIKIIMDFLVGLYTLTFSVFLLKQTFTMSSDKEDSELGLLILIIASVYTIAMFTLGASFIFANNYGISALIWSFILIIFPFLFIKLRVLNYLFN
ncbi:hypothetical protein WAX74_19095 [Psychrobacillus sp. FJAT-51614]|uniref:Uncharacterized protein n=1 Tax=Psychrobacillus mangrovi TaxID=3117745 RepID=A0ABU8F9Q0_9BACI